GSAQAQGWYAGLDVGTARSETKITEYGFFGDTTGRANGDTTGFRFSVGYQFGRYFALDLAYVDFGQFENHFDPTDCPFGAPLPCPVDVRTSINGVIASMVGVLPLGEHWFVDARLGYGKMNVDADARGTVNTDDSGANDALHYGIGGGYRFDDHWEAALYYSAYDREDFGLTLGG